MHICCAQTKLVEVLVYALNIDMPIAISVAISRPCPAFIRGWSNGDFRPEACNIFRGILRGRHSVNSTVSDSPAVNGCAGFFNSPDYIIFKRVLREDYHFGRS